MEVTKKDLNLSPYWSLAGSKLRKALEELPEEGVPKKYPVSLDGAARTLVIGGAKPSDVTYETGNLSLATEGGINVVRLALELPISVIELRDITVSGNPT